MSSLPKLISLLANKFGDLLAPQTPESIKIKIKNSLADLLKIFANYSQAHLEIIHNLLLSLLEEANAAESNGFLNIFIKEIGRLNLLPQLARFVRTHKCQPLVKEIYYFFTELSKLRPFLSESFFIISINKLLEKFQPPNNEILQNIVSDLLLNVERIPFYILSDISAPLLKWSFFNLSENHHFCGEFALNLVLESKNNQNLLSYLSSSLFIEPCITFIIECLSVYSVDRKKQSFLDYINRTLSYAPQQYAKAITNSFDTDVITPFVIEEEPITALHNSIYLLISFDCNYLVKPLLEFLEGALVDFLESKDDRIRLLAIRCATLLFESTEPLFGETPNSFRTVSDFMCFARPQWFVRPDISTYMNSVSSRVNFSYSFRSTMTISDQFDLSDINDIYERNIFKWNVSNLFSKLCLIFSNFVNNSVNVNLALTEFFVAVASMWGPGPSYWALSKECDNGFVKALADVCSIMEKRIGTHPEIISYIQNAYGMFEKTDKKIKNEITSVEQTKYLNLIVLLEFLKEIHATVQAKNQLNQRNRSGL